MKKSSLICSKKCEEMSIGELIGISYEMLESSSVLCVYDGRYLLSSGILLDDFADTSNMLTMLYENTTEMLVDIPFSIEWLRGTIEYLSFNPHVSMQEFMYRSSCVDYLISKRFSPKVFGITDIGCVYIQFGLVFVDGYFRIVSFRV